jgi:RNA polymerase sigma-70 factor (ECF subfamily)
MAPPPPPFADLLAQARAGTRGALGEILEACRPYLYAVAQDNLEPDLRVKGSASDLVQETFLEAQRDFGQFHGTSQDELLAWLRQLLLHNLFNFTRRYRETAGRAIDREVPLAPPGAQPAQPTGAGPSPLEEVLAREQEQRLQQALLRLPEDHRQVLLWRYQEQLPFEEIARRLDRTANAARKLWARAVENLRHEIEKPG